LNLFLLPEEHRACLVALIVVATCVFPASSLAMPQAGDAQAAFNQALELLQSGKTADALAVIDSAIKDGVRDPSLYNLKGLAAGELGRDQEAEDSFRTVIKLARVAVEAWARPGGRFGLPRGP
jgi:Flp pilus assembly protein TadD